MNGSTKVCGDFFIGLGRLRGAVPEVVEVLYPGIVDQYVQPWEVGLQPRNETGSGIVVGDVTHTNL